jgi:transposase
MCYNINIMGDNVELEKSQNSKKLKETQRKTRFSARRENAIDLLSLGKSHVEVAEAIGVKACTITGWVNHNESFAAELKRRREEIWEDSIEKLRALTRPAIEVLEEQLNSENERIRQSAAVHILRTTGLYDSSLSLGSGEITITVKDETVEKKNES